MMRQKSNRKCWLEVGKADDRDHCKRRGCMKGRVYGFSISDYHYSTGFTSALCSDCFREMIDRYVTDPAAVYAFVLRRRLDDWKHYRPYTYMTPVIKIEVPWSFIQMADHQFLFHLSSKQMHVLPVSYKARLRR